MRALEQDTGRERGSESSSYRRGTERDMTEEEEEEKILKLMLVSVCPVDCISTLYTRALFSGNEQQDS